MASSSKKRKKNSQSDLLGQYIRDDDEGVVGVKSVLEQLNEKMKRSDTVDLCKSDDDDDDDTNNNDQTKSRRNKVVKKRRKLNDPFNEEDNYDGSYDKKYSNTFGETLETIVPTSARSHPQLVALDKLNLTYQGWQADKAKVQGYHYKYPILVDDEMRYMERKQRVYIGDRSHPQLIALDKLNLTYQGWQADKAKVQNYHYKYPALVDDEMRYMERKQRVHIGDRSHPQLVALEQLNLTYQGWQADKAKVQNYHYKYPTLVDDEIKSMELKQRVHIGDRSHRQLVALDKLKLTYQGWQADKAKVQDYHYKYPNLVDDEIKSMERKQRVHIGDRSHRQLVALDNMNLTYQGWQVDKARVENSHYYYPRLVDDKMKSMERKQRVHIGDRSHRQLVALDKLNFTYQGWKADKARVEDSHYYYPRLVDDKIKSMKQKQRVHIGKGSHPGLIKLEKFK